MTYVIEVVQPRASVAGTTAEKKSPTTYSIVSIITPKSQDQETVLMCKKVG